MKRIQLAIGFIASTLLFSEALAQNPDYGKLLVDAINSPSAEKRTELIRESFSAKALVNPGVEALAKLLTQWNSFYAPLEYHHSEINEFKQAGTVYVMHVYARKKGSPTYKDFQIYLDPQLPRKLEKIAFTADVAEPVNLPNGAIEQPETIAWLEKYAEKLRSENDLSGSYFIAKGNKILFDKQIGFEELTRKKSINKNTLFNIASGGKMFTAISIAQLVEGGKLNYDDVVTKYLTGFSDPTKADEIKISNLLSHTSGVAEYWSGQTDQAVLSATSTNDHLKIVYEAGFESEAGKTYRYCNSNFILLGAIIEKVTGASFYDYVKKNIFDRAGMTASGYFNYGSPGIATSLAYNEQKTGWKEARHGIRGSSAGGAYSTLSDIMKFCQALKNGTLIKGASLTELTTIHNGGLKATEDYGYGFIISGLGGEPSFGHGGTTDGVNFEFQYYPRQDITLITFCNQNNGAYDDLKKNMIKLITGHR